MTFMTVISYLRDLTYTLCIYHRTSFTLVRRTVMSGRIIVLACHPFLLAQLQMYCTNVQYLRKIQYFISKNYERDACSSPLLLAAGWNNRRRTTVYCIYHYMTSLRRTTT